MRRFLFCCPFCASSKMWFYAGADRDCLTCRECGARWHLYIEPLLRANFEWAELEIPSSNGKGADLIGKRLNPEEWRKMALQASKNPPPPPVTKEKETIIKEIVMVPCRYCGGLMPQTSVFCPNCGAKRNS